MFVGLPIGGLVSLGSGLILLVDFLLQDRPSKPLVVHPRDLSSLKLSLNQLEERKLPPDCKSETIDIPLLDASTRGCLKSIVEQGFLTSEEVTKLQLSNRNLALAIQSAEGSDVSYLADLALSVDQALRFVGKWRGLTAG